MKFFRLFLMLAGASTGFSCLAAEPTPPANWENHCSSCHGPDGKGNTRIGRRLAIKDMTKPEFQASFTDERAFKSIKEGLNTEGGKTLMKPIEGVSDPDIEVLVAYVRALARK